MSELISSSLETYLEAIYLLRDAEGYAHTTEIAEHLGVRKPSVTGALRSLAEKELISYKPYRPITLTEEGLKLSKAIHYRHTLLRDFFKKVLGIPEEIAEKNADALEHHISPLVQARLVAFINFVESCVEQRFVWKDPVGFECFGKGDDCMNCNYTAYESATNSK